jgi:PAS domain S-box-containing protein
MPERTDAEAPLRILHVEDDPNDRELARSTLVADGLTVSVAYVDSRVEFERALLTDMFDVILADYSLPSFDGLTAQAIARRLAPDVPFIFLSGTLGEELAIERLQDGATDYVLKQRIARLPAAIRRARAEAAERQQRRLAEEELRRLNHELESRVRERTRELAAVNGELEKREAQRIESEQWLQAILDHNPAAIAVKDLDGRYLLMNHRVEVLSGKSRAEIVGRTDQEIWPRRMADQYQANDRRVAKERHAMEFEEPMPFADGVHIVSASRFPLFDAAGDLRAVCGFSRDITARKKIEDDLRLARLEARRANLAKSEFLSRMSHDLRTPLNAILGFAQLLEAEEMTAPGADSVREILNGGRHLLDLINEVLDITRIESGHLALSSEPVLVHDVLERTVNLIRPLANQRGLFLDVRPLPPGEPAVLADRQRLGQILINLLSNAVKYNQRNGRITIAVLPSESGTTLRIAVTDTGAGIPPEKLKLLFQPFERLGAESTAVEGTGLGLALSRALAQAMGAELGVESVVNQGTTFWIQLKTSVAPASADTRRAEPIDPQAVVARTGTVLYIEDNPANVRLMSRILERRPGLILKHAPEGAAAFALLRERLPDLILLDLHLPDMPGDEILRRLWAEPATRAIPKVVVTADASPGLMSRLRAAGAVACLTKPLEVAEILRLLDQRLGAAEASPRG